MKRPFVLILTVLMFVFVNVFLYVTITSRLANNYSGTSSLKMINVASFLPFVDESKLARTGSSLKFNIDDDLPVLDGAAALVPVYASVIDNCYPKGTVTYKGGAFSDDNYYGENFAADSVMQYQNTIRGFNALVDGKVDLFFTAHPSKEQMEYAKEKGVELEIVPIGLEAFVFFVNKNNPVNALTSEQIRSIYKGDITNWSEVGGINRGINPLVRVKGSGSQTMMDKFMGENAIQKRRLTAVFGKAIGYSFRYYLSGMVADDNTKMLAVDGIYPDAINIRNRTYPLTANFYVAYRKDNQNENVERLVSWLLSSEGQTMIEACGYVGLSN